MIDPTVQAFFKRCRHFCLSTFTISQEQYEIPKQTIRSKGKIYHIFKPNDFRDVQNLYQDKVSMDMTFNDFKYLTFTCWDNKYQPQDSYEDVSNDLEG